MVFSTVFQDLDDLSLASDLYKMWYSPTVSVVGTFPLTTSQDSQGVKIISTEFQKFTLPLRLDMKLLQKRCEGCEPCEETLEQRLLYFSGGEPIGLRTRIMD